MHSTSSDRLKSLSLFSGIGGFDLGLQKSGIDPVAFCEMDRFCQRVLRSHWPDVPIIDDVRDVTGESLKEVVPRESIGTIDIVAGGFP